MQETQNPNIHKGQTNEYQRKKYEPDLKSKTKYPISDHVCSHRLYELYAFTVNQLSFMSIPSNVQDALADPEWKNAMNEEMDAL